VESITQLCWIYSSSIQQWKNFENRLRFEKVIAKSLVAYFIIRQLYKYSYWLYVWFLVCLFWSCVLSTFYPRDAMLARVIAIATCLSVRLSVRLSVTRRYCVKTKKASGMISSPSGSPKNLVFWRQVSSPNSKGFPPNGCLKQGSVGKIQRFFSFKRQYLENGSRYGQSYY